VIRFDRMSKSYGRHTAVAGLDLVIAPGEVVALLGPNGSGKSTVLKAAAGLVRPSSGRVLVGEDALSADDPKARRAISYLAQDVAFPEALTGREVVEFYRRVRGASLDRVQAALRAAALEEAAGRPVGTYSGGMVQRLGLAVATLTVAPVLLLDEPTASLDAEGLSTSYALVEDQRGAGRTVLFTSHSWGDVERLADRVTVMVEGRLVADLRQPDFAARFSLEGARLDRLYRKLGEGAA
jgi:Cu-processing system ATP-binding protein